MTTQPEADLEQAFGQNREHGWPTKTRGKLLVKRLPLVLLWLAVTLSHALGQTVTQIAPLPSQWGYSGSWFLDSQKGFLCGGMKSLHRTLDGGLSWAKIDLPGFVDAPIYSVRFFDANIGIATGNSADGSRDIFRTTDGGTTWTQVQNFPLGGSWYFQDYINSTTGFIGSNGAMVRSTDAGATWESPLFLPRLSLDDGHGFS